MHMSQLRKDATLGPGIPTFLADSTTFDASVPVRGLTLLWESLSSGGDDGKGFRCSSRCGEIPRDSGQLSEEGPPTWGTSEFAREGLKGDPVVFYLSLSYSK